MSNKNVRHKYHFNMNHNIIIHKCDLCNSKFETRSKLKNHKKYLHTIDIQRNYNDIMDRLANILNQ